MKKQHKLFPPGSPQEWLKHAASDLALAHLGMNSENVLAEQICFHAQQVVEKALKAILIYKNIRFPLIHDLEALLEIAQQSGLAIPAWADEVATLTPYAVETRYPGHWEDFQSSDAQQALKLAQQVLEWADSIIRNNSSDK